MAFLGRWLFFTILQAIVSVGAVEIIVILWPPNPAEILAYAVPFACSIWSSPVLGLIWTVLWWDRSRRKPPGHCLTCGYNLTGLTESRCPECGTGFALPVDKA